MLGRSPCQWSRRSPKELRKMRMSELQKRARGCGVDSDVVDDAADAEYPKAELIALYR